MRRRHIPYLVLAEPCPDIPGEWSVLCLTWDIASQGRSLEHAASMIQEAVGLAIEDELRSGQLPRLRPAPLECWAPYREMVVDRSARKSRFLPAKASAPTLRRAALWMAVIPPRTPGDDPITCRLTGRIAHLTTAVWTLSAP